MAKQVGTAQHIKASVVSSIYMSSDQQTFRLDFCFNLVGKKSAQILLTPEKAGISQLFLTQSHLHHPRKLLCVSFTQNSLLHALSQVFPQLPNKAHHVP